jgi:outer membrane protein assembly factor BamA
VSLAAGAVHYRYTPLSESEAFLGDFSETPLSGTDVSGRVTLIVDTRDNEFLPANGVLLEAGVYAGSGHFEERTFSPPCIVCAAAPFIASTTTGGYAGGYAHLRGFISLRSGTVIAGRLAARALDRGAPLDARYTLPGWERDITVLGGAESHRSFVPGRFVGRGLLLGSLEIRHNILDVGDYGAVTLIAFADAGRVSGANSIRWTLDGWKAGGGGGVALRVLRSALLTFNFAGGPDGFTFSMGNGWAF